MLNPGVPWWVAIPAYLVAAFGFVLLVLELGRQPRVGTCFPFAGGRGAVRNGILALGVRVLFDGRFMYKKFTAVTILIVPSMVALAGEPENLKVGAIITKVGDYKAFDGQLALKVSETDGKLKISLSPSFAPFTTFDFVS